MSEDKIVISFNTQLNKLMNIVYNKNKKDQNVYDIKEMLKSAIRIDRYSVISIAGPHMWNYREEIKRGDVEFFLNKDFSAEIKAEKGIKNYEQALEFITLLKSTWSKFTEEEQKYLTSAMQNLLSTYAEYLLISAATK